MAVTIDSTRAVLHNCLPMLIYPMANSQFCLIPVAGRPAGLLLFWSHSNNEITVSEYYLTSIGHAKAWSVRIYKENRYTAPIKAVTPRR